MSGRLLCPRCPDAFSFSSVSELQVHLITQHTYETLLLLSQTCGRSLRPQRRSLPLPLPAPMEDQTQSSTSGTEPRESHRALEGSGLVLDQVLSSGTGLVLDWSRLTETLLTVDLGLEERLGLGLGLAPRLVRTLVEVEDRVNRKVDRLKSKLHHKEVQLHRQRITEGKLRAERDALGSRVEQLSGQVCAAEKLMKELRTQLQQRETELLLKQQEMEQIESFLQGLAQKEADAKVKLQVFIESLLDRAEHAERQLLQLTHQALSRSGLEQVLTRQLQESTGNRRSFSLSDSDRALEHSVWEFPPMRTLSLGSPDEDTPLNTTRFVETGWGQTWSKSSPRHHGNEEDQDRDDKD